MRCILQIFISQQRLLTGCWIFYQSLSRRSHALQSGYDLGPFSISHVRILHFITFPWFRLIKSRAFPRSFPDTLYVFHVVFSACRATKCSHLQAFGVCLVMAKSVRAVSRISSLTTTTPPRISFPSLPLRAQDVCAHLMKRI